MYTIAHLFDVIALSEDTHHLQHESTKRYAVLTLGTVADKQILL